MSSTTITMSAGTWILEGNSTGHSSDNLLRCGRRYGNNNPNTYAVLQFAIPSALKYKRITFAQIKYYSYWYLNGSQAQHQGDAGMELAPFISDGSALSTLTGANYNSKGELGSWITVEAYSPFLPNTYPCWRTADVSSVINGNVDTNGNFTVFDLFIRVKIVLSNIVEYI